LLIICFLMLLISLQKDAESYSLYALLPTITLFIMARNSLTDNYEIRGAVHLHELKRGAEVVSALRYRYNIGHSTSLKALP